MPSGKKTLWTAPPPPFPRDAQSHGPPCGRGSSIRPCRSFFFRALASAGCGWKLRSCVFLPPPACVLQTSDGQFSDADGWHWRPNSCPQGPAHITSSPSASASSSILVVRSLSGVQLFVSPWTVARRGSLSLTISQSLLKLMSIESMMPSNHLIHCCPLLLLPAIFPSIRVFASELALCIRWLNYWSFSFSISPSNEYSGLFSFRIDWFGLLVVQGTLKSLLQYHSSKASVLWLSIYFMV